MTKIERNRFQKALQSKQLESESGSRSRGAFCIETTGEELDPIQQAQERDYAMGVPDRQSTRLRQVRAALKRIETAAFGICLNCGQHISVKRLAAAPWTELCIVCQEGADNVINEPWLAIDSPRANAA